MAASYLGLFAMALRWPCDGHENCLKSSIFALQMHPFSSGDAAGGGHQRHAASGHLLLPFYLTFSSISPILLQKQRKWNYRRNRSLSQKTKRRKAKSQRQGAMKASFPAADDDSRESAAVTSAVEIISRNYK